MNAGHPPRVDERVLIHAPKGRDAEVVAQVLWTQGMRTDVCASLADLATRLEQGAGLAFVTEEALSEAVIDTLAGWLGRQPPWSDFPFVVLATRRVGRRGAKATGALARLGNVMLLERPLNSETLVSAARSALRARARQYEARRHLEQQELARQAERVATAAAARANAALELALDGAELGTFHCPWPFRKMVWNERCKTHFWLPADAAVDFDTFYSIIHPEDRERAHAAMEAAVADDAPYDVEYRAVSPDGQWRWIRAKGRVFRDATGQPTRFDGVTLDISRQKQLEVEREILLGAERDARTQAERASRMKDQFLATLSHELRTPLSSILGWTHLLARRDSADVDIDKAVATIERNARAQARLIEELLDVSRITSGNLQLDIRPVAMASVVEAVLASLKPAADAKRIDLAFEPRGSAPEIPGDAHRLQQVVWNLLSNAIKFTPQRGRVLVTLESGDEGLLLCVADTGEGIPAEFLPHVFERFRQADASEARTHGGLGLGLAIARHIVELHGGTVHVESAGLGQGSRFSVRLPHPGAARHAGSSEPRAAAEASSAPDGETADFDLSGVRIVLVDDEPDGREMIASMLLARGAGVAAADSADQALSALRDAPADLVISDIGMPRVDGYELMRRIRRADAAALRDIPAIALTAFARAEDEARARAAGYDLHLAKPVEPTRLFGAVHTLLAHKRRAAKAG